MDKKNFNTITRNPFLLFLLFSLSCLSPIKGLSTSLTLTDRQLCDLEMIMVGGFFPLDGFLGEADYESVVTQMRLANGKLWPIPIILDVDQQTAKQIRLGDQVQLKNEDGVTYAIIYVTDIWTPDKTKEALLVYGTLDKAHPGVEYLLEKSQDIYIGGPITEVQRPLHYDFEDLRKTPRELHSFFRENGIDKIVGFQTRNPMHKAHVALTQMAAKQTGAHLLINPVVGKTNTGDIDPYTRVRCYRKILKYFPENQTTLSVLPLAMRMAGPREALWHSLIRKNYGCTHFIVGRDHAGPSKDGNPFYDPYAAQELVKEYEEEMGIELVAMPEVVFVKEDQSYLPVSEVEPGMTELKISGTELRRRLRLGLDIPSFLSYPEIIEELRTLNPPLSKQGVTLFFTGLSGAGKSTLAKAVTEKLSEIQHRKITLLDGDVIRRQLSPELGFSASDRSLNVRRVGFVANEITKNGGIAICAMIAPYEIDRLAIRESISNSGKYLEVHVSTPLEICEKRDIKGLYGKARQGLITNFTGIDDPYEVPANPELTIDTSHLSIWEAINTIIDFLKEENYLLPN
ncbi:MAG: bifunctional sulfate adenylyltransferase/adenylylsulfate kinase [Waddliaceae bacterium]